MSETGYITLRVNRSFDEPAERVFDAWLEHENAGRWLFATSTGQMIQVEIDPRVGGSYLIVDRRPDGDAEHFGQYLEIDRPHRLTFTFSVDKHDRAGDRVNVEIDPSIGGCQLTLTHEMAGKWAGWEEQTLSGWKDILAGLAQTLQNR